MASEWGTNDGGTKTPWRRDVRQGVLRLWRFGSIVSDERAVFGVILTVFEAIKLSRVVIEPVIGRSFPGRLLQRVLLKITPIHAPAERVVVIAVVARVAVQRGAFAP